MLRELELRGIKCSPQRLLRIRVEEGIETLQERRRRLKAERKYVLPPAFNLLQRNFHVSGFNRVWVGDMTVVRTRAGYLFLSILLDLYSRRVVGWGMGERPDLELAMSALAMALLQRLPKPGLIHHTDRGNPYRSAAYLACLKKNGVIPSMSAPYTWADNAIAEQFFRTLKEELVKHVDFVSREQAKAALFDYIEIFYNRQRRHSRLGYISPMEFEERRNPSFVTI